MREKWHNTNDINEKLGDYLDVDQAWEQFGNKRKRRGFIFDLKLGLALLLLFSTILGSLYLYNTNNLTQETAFAENSNQTNKNTIVHEESNDIKSNHQEEALKTQKRSFDNQNEEALKTQKRSFDNQNEEALKTQKNRIEQHNAQTQFEAERNHQIETESKAQTLKQKKNQSQDKAQNKKTEQHNNILANTQESTILQKNNPEPTDFFEEDAAMPLDLNDGQIVKSFKESPVTTNDEIIEKTNDEIIEKTNEKINDETIEQLASKESLFFSTHNNRDANRDIVEAQTLPNSNKKALPDFEKPAYNNFWQIGIEYAYNIPQRELSSEFIGEDTGGEYDYNLNRKNGEKMQEMQSFSLQLHRSFAKHLYFGTGLGINQYRSKIVDQIQLVESELLENQIIEIRTKNGVDTNIFGTVIATTTKLVQKTRYQKYRSLYIPLEIGLQFPIYKNWNIQMGTGLNYTLFHQAKGKTYNTAFVDGNYQALKENDYKIHGLLAGTANLKIGRNFGDNLNIMLGVNAQKDLNNRMKASTNAIDKFSGFGAELGIYKRF